MNPMPYSISMTLQINPTLFRACGTQDALRVHLQAAGVWPAQFWDEWWQMDIAAPGAYLVHLTCPVSLPGAARP
jgi:hypothetical protein